MTRRARLDGAGPRARLPEHAGGGIAVAGSGAVEGRSEPQRTCVGCRGRGPRSVLVRVVRVEQEGREGGRATLDLRRSMPGRGAWLHADPDCLALAERRRALPRALRVQALDVSGLRVEFDTHLGASGSKEWFTDMGSGSSADGHPMSTSR